MMDHSMAITKNNGGGSKNHLSSLQDDGSAYRQAYSHSQRSGEQLDAQGNVVPIVFVSVTGVLVLLRLLCCGVRNDDAAEEQDAGGGNRARQPPPPLESNEAGRRWADDASTVAAAVEVAPVPAAELPLVCTYRKADGWVESSCGVCLADLADGEALRVLPACLHYFHAACVNEWLRGHDTCPLCRAPLVVAPADTTYARRGHELLRCPMTTS